MSWSITAVGRPAAVLAKVTAEAAKIKCREPEETIKAIVVEAVRTALSAYPDNFAVRVEASGSQSTGNFPINDKYVNTLRVSIEPLYDFVV